MIKSTQWSDALLLRHGHLLTRVSTTMKSSAVVNADMVHAARAAQLPREHDLDVMTDVCKLCGRTAVEIAGKKKIACNALPNHKPAVPPW